MEVTPRIPTNGQYNLDIISFEGRIGEQIIQPNVNGILTTEIQPNSILSVSFIITDGVGINPNTPAGTYGNVVDIFELDPENNNQRIVGSSTQVNYQISIEESNPSISVSGLDGNNELVFTGEEDSAPTQTITITNNGNRDFGENELKLVFPNPIDKDKKFEDSDGNKINFKYKIIGTQTIYQSITSNIVSLPSLSTEIGSNSLEISFQADIQLDIDLDTYSGQLSIQTINPDFVNDFSTNLDSNLFNLVVKVEPEICSDGRLAKKVPVSGPNEGNGLRIEIDSPDNDDDFNIGEEFDVEVTVKNKAGEDLEAVVEVILYDLDNNDKIDSWETDSVSIDKDDESDDFTLTISFPNDDSLDGDGTYILYVKAVDDGNEDEYCNYDSIQINLNRESDDVIINALTMNPTVIAPGDLMSITIGVENIGKDDQTDVYVKLSNPELGLDITSDAFDLKKYSKTSDNDMVKTFTFTVPENAAAKEYYIEAIVYDKKGKQYDNNDLSKVLGKIMIQGEPVAEETTTPEDTTPTIDNTNTGAGAYQPTTGSSVWDNIGSTKTLFVIGDIVLVILAVLFLILIFKKR